MPEPDLREALRAATREAERVLERAGLRIRNRMIAIAVVLEDPRAPAFFFQVNAIPDEADRLRHPRDAALLANTLGEAAADACPPPPAVLRDVIR